MTTYRKQHANGLFGIPAHSSSAQRSLQHQACSFLSITGVFSDNKYKRCFIQAALAYLLLQLGERFGGREKDAITITVPITYADLASWIAATRESINHEMRKLMIHSSISMRKKTITILNEKHFRETAGEYRLGRFF